MGNTVSQNGQQNADTMDNKSYLIEHEKVEGTPFTLIKSDGNWFGVMGQNRLTEPYADKEECKKEVTKITWDRLVQVMWVISEKLTTKEK